MYVPILLVLDQFHVPLHIFDIAWMEGNTVRVASLRVSRGNYRNLLITLKFVLESQTNGSY